MKIGNSNYRRLIAKVALLGLLAVCGGASPAHAQETVAGKFSLSESVRLGGKMLPAGAYTFTIEPAGQSAGAIVGNHEKVVLVVRSEAKGGPVAAIFASAWKTYRTAEASKLVLTPAGDGKAIQSLILGEQGLELELN